MKKQNLAKLHSQTIDQLKTGLSTLQKQLVITGQHIKNGKQKNTGQLKGLRYQIAVHQTLITAKQLTLPKTKGE